MPELPEVETVRRGLAPAMENSLLVKVEVNRPNLRFPFPENFAACLLGRKILQVARRAKYLTLVLDNDEILVMHLGMSGSFHVEEKGDNDTYPNARHHTRNRIAAHDHVIFHLQGESGSFRVIYNDPRRFGFMDLIARDKISTHKLFINLGLEPTGNSLDGDVLIEMFSGRKASLKSALLDQKLIAGLGNIYVCEALWCAGLLPTRPADSICTTRAIIRTKAARLADAIRQIIRDAIEAGGSSLNDHRQTDGTLGYFQHRFKVYDREGEDCLRDDCKGTIRRIVQSGRSTYFCAKCQK